VQDIPAPMAAPGAGQADSGTGGKPREDRL
jgi:hypothetical protein